MMNSGEIKTSGSYNHSREERMKQERAVLLFGSLLVLTGVVCNEWVLAGLFSSDGEIALSRRVVIWLFELAVIAAGTVLVVKRRALKPKWLLFSLVMMLIMLLAIEVALHASHYVMNYSGRSEPEDRRYLTKPYEGKPWAMELFREYEEMSGEYKDYRGWGKREFHGKFINIDNRGVRKTWAADYAEGNSNGKVYMFGGSTIWGDGARDDHTIPSYVSRLMHEKGYGLSVYNYGEWAYSYTQGIVYLMLLLRDGHRPDYVIFYDGIADIYGAYQGGVPGQLHYSFSLRDRFRKKEYSPLQYSAMGFKEFLNRYSRIYAELVKMNRRLDPPKQMFQEVGHRYSDSRLEELSTEIVDYYQNSMALLDGLSRIYGFKYLCFWQPVSFTEEHLTDDEAGSDIRFGDTKLIKLHQYTQARLETISNPNFHNISDVLAGKTDTYYIDFAHISEQGNAVVADKIFSVLEKEHLAHD